MGPQRWEGTPSQSLERASGAGVANHIGVDSDKLTRAGADVKTQRHEEAVEIWDNHNQ